MSAPIHLDARLSLAFDLYDPCGLAADIGTDHAHLPAALLQRGRCQHMVLTDLSPDALRNARGEMTRFGLADRVDFRLGDGFLPLREEERFGMISVTGMGGRTLRDILLSGQSRLNGASLLLSAHTDLPLVRDAVSRIGYHLVREEPCFCNRRYYLLLLARPGIRPVSPREIRLGGPLFSSSSSWLLPYLSRRREVLSAGLEGLKTAAEPDREAIAQAEEDIAFYDAFLAERRYTHERSGNLPAD